MNRATINIKKLIEDDVNNEKFHDKYLEISNQEGDAERNYHPMNFLRIDHNHHLKEDTKEERQEIKNYGFMRQV